MATNDASTAVMNFNTDDESTVCCDAYTSIFVDSDDYFCKKCLLSVTKEVDSNGNYIRFLFS